MDTTRSAGDVQRLVSAVIKHADGQHEDSEWSIVFEGMRRDEIASVLTTAGARTTKQAIRAMRSHLASLRVPVLV